MRRFTSVAEKLMNLIPTDIGRPFAHINPDIVLPDLGLVLREVVDKLATRELEVRDTAGHWYNLRIRPYKTVDNRIEGALLALMDIDSMKRSAARAQQMLEYEEALAGFMREPLVVLGPGCRVERANPTFHRVFEIAREEARGRALRELVQSRIAWERLEPLLEAPAGPTRTATLDMAAAGGERRPISIYIRRLVTPGDGDETVLVGFSVQ